MAKGPTYSEEEQKMLQKLARRDGSPTLLAREFCDAFPSTERSETALVQKIRKMTLELFPKEPKAPKPAKPKPAPRAASPARVNAAPLSDETKVAGAQTRVRKPSTFIQQPGEAAVEGKGHGNGNGNGNGHSEAPRADLVSVDLGGLTLTGSKKRVGEALQQLG